MNEKLINQLTDLIMAEYRKTVNEDCLGDMMAFLDSRNYSYEHLIDPSDDEYSNKKIREIFTHAYYEYVMGDVRNKIGIEAKKELLNN